MKLIRSLLSFAAVSLLATSCASFPGNKLPKVAETPASNVKKVPLTYTLKAGSNITGSRVELDGSDRYTAEKQIKDSFNKSGRFTSVSQGKGCAVHVDVDVLNHGNKAAAGASGFITGLSLFTIPGAATDHYKLTATARTSSGKSRQYVLEDSSTIVLWLPLIVLTPFNDPGSVGPRVVENMYRNLMVNMERDGILPKAGG